MRLRAVIGRLLSARERQVAALVAGGRTNREIATELAISARTAETHVLNIFNKLGFRRRTEIAAWAVRQGLPEPGRDASPDLAPPTYSSGGGRPPHRLR
ncbi:MAG: helix-turn-helix transcriptional regulator [Armatimonadota bacterium]|nr:helix-turn-helix transcriptional regulator [Armatimonadota bacterium]MDR7386179.1 helix-turn-helix transcriptional regulator [Armatimonadota bacterium]MDR7407648.1 helix-turn-helix transcriptional regulator [Armatimonadota bacterium]MDR7414804.1 helix-turn-helix transcriptional regulator [Armatimonadota bacterium]MDR7433013.1 helix-turn-helix transcriptional regulator [Armatimonadota bacterium]